MDEAPIPPVVGGHIANIVTWLCLIIATFSIATRFAVKWVVARRFGLDDGFAIVAFIFTILSGVAATIEVCKGADLPHAQLSNDDLKAQLLGAYMAQIFYFAVLAFAKLSIVAFIRHISPVIGHRRLTMGLAVFIALVWVSETIAIAVECSPPRPWDTVYGTCFDLEAFWHFVGAMNIFTDLCLVVLAFLVTKNLQMATKKKAIVLGCFAARLVDVAATAVQILYSSALRKASSQPQMWEFVMSIQIVQCVTIVTSCIPYLRGLLECMPSGMYLSDEIRRRALHSKEATRVQNSSYALSDVEREKNAEKNSSKRRSGASMVKVTHGTTISNIFTRTDISQYESESAEHINAEARLSRTVTVETTSGRTRELSEGNISLTAPFPIPPTVELA